MSGRKKAYLKFVCENDSLYLLMGNRKQQHCFFYGPCQIDILDVPHLEFATPKYAGISHFLENHEWEVEVYKVDGDSLSKQVFLRPLAYAPEKFLLAIPDTGHKSQVLIWNYQSQETQAVRVDSCIYGGDPLPCIMDVKFRGDSLVIWHESKKGLEMDSLKAKIRL